MVTFTSTNLEGRELLQQFGRIGVSAGYQILVVLASNVFQSHLDQHVMEFLQLHTHLIQTENTGMLKHNSIITV